MFLIPVVSNRRSNWVIWIPCVFIFKLNRFHIILQIPLAIILLLITAIQLTILHSPTIIQLFHLQLVLAWAWALIITTIITTIMTVRPIIIIIIHLTTITAIVIATPLSLAVPPQQPLLPATVMLQMETIQA